MLADEKNGISGREVVTFFKRQEALDEALSRLQGMGFDRADISMVSRKSFEEIESGRSEPYAKQEGLDGEQGVPVTDTDVRQVRTMASGMSGAIAGIGAGAAVLLRGGMAAAAVAAIAAGGAAAAIASAVGKNLGDNREGFLKDEIANGGVVVWVKTPRPDVEKRQLTHLEKRMRCRFLPSQGEERNLMLPGVVTIADQKGENMNRSGTFAIILAVAFTLVLAACEDDGPVENVGEAVDETVEGVGDAVEDATE